MKSTVVHSKPLKKIDWYNTSFRILARTKFSPNDMLRMSLPDTPIKLQTPADTSPIRETPVPCVNFEMRRQK
jgi:hypothetical protein